MIIVTTADLKTSLKNATDARDYIEKVWESSAKNTAAVNHVTGAIDALRFTKFISLKQYDELYNEFVYRNGRL